jgi:hypothetical protein
MNTSGPIDCTPFSFLIPCRRPSAHDPTEVLVQKYKSGNSPESRLFEERTIKNRTAYQLITIALTCVGWESHTAPGDGSQALKKHELQPEELLSDLIRIAVTKTIGAQYHLIIGSTMPFYYRSVGRGESPSHATGISLQIVGKVSEDFVWISPDELLAAETTVLVTPATRSEGFTNMIRQSVALFEQSRVPGVMALFARALSAASAGSKTDKSEDGK